MVWFLDALELSEEGPLFSDVDQCWKLEVYADSGQLFLREGDFDTGEWCQTIAVSREDVMRQISELRQRVVPLLKELSIALGRDFQSGNVVST